MDIKQFIKAKAISNRLNSQFKNVMTFESYLVEEYCAQVETEHICDTDLMWKFENVPLTIGHGLMVLLPCNVYRIIEVFDDGDRRLEYHKNESFLIRLRDWQTKELLKEDDTIYISYYGIPVDVRTGELLIPSGHQPACENYCKMKFFEPGLIDGSTRPDVWQMWDQKFSNQVTAIRSAYRHIDNTKIEETNIITGNMLPMIGQMALSHKEFE